MNKKKKLVKNISLSVVYFVVALMCYYFDYNLMAFMWVGLGSMYLCKCIINYANSSEIKSMSDNNNYIK